MKALSLYSGNTFVQINSSKLKLPEYIQSAAAIGGSECFETENLEEAISELDVLYMTRVQRERFESEADYLEVKDKLILDGTKMQKAKSDMIVLQPLPRVNEIAPEVDDDPRALYFKQAEYGMYVRMSLVLHLLNIDGCSMYQKQYDEEILSDKICTNDKCITKRENYLSNLFLKSDEAELVHRCAYCDSIR